MPQPKGYGSAQAPDAAPDELDSLRDELERQRAKLEQAERDRALLTDEMQLEHALLDAVVRQMPAGLAVADALTGLFVLRNEQASLIWGRDPSGPLLERFEELRGRRADGTPLASDEWPLARSIHEGETVAGEEIWFTRFDGSEGVMEVSATPVRDATGRVTAGVALLLDVTDRKRTEERLQSAQAEREVLLREARHQVGNNLQVVTSLLGLQARATRDDESRKLVLESLSRIQAMAQAHEQISQAPDLAHIDLNLYIGQIVEGLRELYVRQENPPVIA
ncbi:MAG: histidine kinase dimerization/phosphoacceptor domain -containing protein, partial [Vicinamibacterales bacterium]|nr:histidine kinase dimerization/phosphoacceptor domain -containing protein [Vicinamibacterales bacterium]